MIQTGTCTNIYCDGEHTDVIFKTTVYNLRILCSWPWILRMRLRERGVGVIVLFIAGETNVYDFCMFMFYNSMAGLDQEICNSYSDLRRILFTKNHCLPE